MTEVATQRPEGLQRQLSLSSFPPSRSPSAISTPNDAKKGRSPQPPMVREDEESTVSTRNSPPLRSQYPADSTEKHVEYILVASFDIDRGSVMEHQYPSAISGDETMLAELMLPDQAHVRSQDWTIFFLHKDTSLEDEEREARRAKKRRQRQERLAAENQEDATARAEEYDAGEYSDDYVSDSDEELNRADDPDGPPLVYVLNLVNTKQDNTVKRGAIVKAMAICTRHSFLHIYKPLLLLALEEYFRAPIMETLASLYNALNDMDLSLMPKLSPLESHVLQATDSKDMFIEKFDQMIRHRKEIEAGKESQRTSASSELKPKPYSLPRDTHEFESKVLYNGIPVPIKVPTALSPETVGDFSLIKLIQTFSTPHTTQPQPFALHPHLTTSGAFTHPIIVLINALLTQKRIIFLGHNRPSGEVAEAVLAACALASGGILRGFVRYAFPYTDLTKIDDLLKVPGFIAGVTNPVFAHTPEWWDLLCDLPTGRMKISPKIDAGTANSSVEFFQQQGIPVPLAGAAQAGFDAKGAVDPTGDNQFMDHLLKGIASRLGENVIRAKWRSWILRFTRIATAFEETVYGASALYPAGHDHDEGAYGVSGHGYVWPDEASRLKELAANVQRIEAWRQTRSYHTFKMDLARRWHKTFIHDIDLAHQHDRLRCLRLTHEQSAAIYLALARVVEEAGRPSTSDSEDDQGLTLDTGRKIAGGKAQYDVILQILSVIPDNAGLFYIAMGLFHPNEEVRVAVVKLLERIMDHAAGRHLWASLGRFAKLAFYRLKREEGHVRGDGV